MLRLENLTKSYTQPNGDVLPVLDIPRFHLAPSEQMALIGRSGCGKSTLLRAIEQVKAGKPALVDVICRHR